MPTRKRFKLLVITKLFKREVYEDHVYSNGPLQTIIIINIYLDRSYRHISLHGVISQTYPSIDQFNATTITMSYHENSPEHVGHTSLTCISVHI